MSQKKTGPQNKAHTFGGSWTTTKLNILEGYLSAYTTALKNQPSLTTAYIDAFAGTGYRSLNLEESPTELLFPDLAEKEPQAWLDGSATIALKAEPKFNRYIFIEKNPARCTQLENLKTTFPEQANDIVIKQGDANGQIKKLCAEGWGTKRAVLFLDPYGTQVEWSTIEAIAKTKAIDLWLLFPLGIGVNRLLTRSGKIPASWKRRLDLLLGTEDWYDEFYQKQPAQDLFEDDAMRVQKVQKASIESIGRYFNKRLTTVFPGVADTPKVLSNSKMPLYLLCFAIGNPSKNAQKVALNIAEHLLAKEF